MPIEEEEVTRIEAMARAQLGGLYWAAIYVVSTSCDCRTASCVQDRRREVNGWFGES